MAGRKPIPTKYKLLKGTAQKCRMRNEPEPEIRIPRAPKHLNKIAKKEWRQISKELHQLGLISEIDRSALAAYCQAFSRWVEAEELIEKSGLLVKTKSGNIIQNPAVGTANRAMELMHKFLTEFGMTPSSRSKVNVTERKKKNPFQLLDGAKDAG